MSPIEPGEWFHRLHPEAPGHYRAIGPWPPLPDHWVVAFASDELVMHPDKIFVVAGSFLTDRCGRGTRTKQNADSTDITKEG